jgi:hypothetical protein
MRTNYKRNKKSKYVTGGMYGSNEIVPGLNPTSTSNIVFNEADPDIQAAREKAQSDEHTKLQAESAQTLTDIENKTAEHKQNLLNSESEFKSNTAAAEQGVSKGLSTITDVASKLKKPGDLNWAGRVAQRGNIAREAGNLKKAGRLASRSAKLGEWSNKAGQAAKWGTATTKAGQMMRNPNVIGTAATVVGEGLNYAFDDKDATKWNAGEVAGGTIAGIGAGVGAATTAAALAGSSLGPIGTAVGAVGGAIYGVGKGLVQRKKARKEKAAQDAERRSMVNEHNTKLSSGMLTQKANTRSGELKQKTYSGYDLGRNVTAKYGGIKKYI